jgi:hypothetical protein
MPATSWLAADQTGSSLRVRAPLRNSQDLWMRFLSNYAATSVSSCSDRSTITPFSNLAPARTNATKCGALTACQQAWADSISF